MSNGQQQQGFSASEPLTFFKSFFSNPIGTAISFVGQIFGGRKKKRKERRRKKAAFANFLAQLASVKKQTADTEQLTTGVHSQISRAKDDQIEITRLIEGSLSPGAPIPDAARAFTESQRPKISPLFIFAAIGVGVFFLIRSRL